MNRTEVLIEALKEVDRHIEALTEIALKSPAGKFTDMSLANRQADEIGRAILSELVRTGVETIDPSEIIQDRNDSILALYSQLDEAQEELSALSKECNILRFNDQESRKIADQELKTMTEQRDRWQQEFERMVVIRDDLVKQRDALRKDLMLRNGLPTNPELENVMAALRMILRYHDERKSDSNTLIYGVTGDTYGASLCVGDLRRWAESEKQYSEGSHANPALSEITERTMKL